MLKKFIVYYLWLAVLASVCASFTDHKILPGAGTWNALELRLIDFLFLFKPQPKENALKDTALIVIDDKSYKNINQPFIFYHTYISAIIDYLVKDGARVIGLDLQLPSISLEGRVAGGYESVFTRAFLNARQKGVDVVIGFSSGENTPLQTYLAAAGKDNLAMLSLSEDRDDFIRRQQLWLEDGKSRYDTLPFLLAKKYIGKAIPVPAQTILIDYSLAQTIAIYPFDEIYNLSQSETGKQGLFKGKVVLIGTFLAHEDRHSTPLYYFPSKEKGRRTAGMVIQATTLNTLLSRSFFHEPNSVTEFLYILFVSILAVYLCFSHRPIPAAFLCLGEAAAILPASIYCFNHLYLIRSIPLFSAVILSYGSTTVFHYYVEERKRIKIRERFASYVPEKIIDKIVDTDIEKLTEGELKEVALLFCDIRGFTAYTEKNKGNPKRVVNFLNEYHKEMTEIVLSNNGTVAQLAGDGMFVFFGAPSELDNPVWSAVKSAVEMRKRLAELKSKWQEYGMEDLRIGIGIHVGDAIVGNIGSVKKMAYVAIGDNTNVASRIESLTKDFKETILVSDRVYNRIQDKIYGRPLGMAEIKGHTEIGIVAVDGIKNTTS